MIYENTNKNWVSIRINLKLIFGDFNLEKNRFNF